MDRAPQREGGLGVGRMWIAALGEVSVYEADLPACCRRSARGVAEGSGSEGFECFSCGAAWREPAAHEHEADAFMRGGEEERGAA